MAAIPLTGVIFATAMSPAEDFATPEGGADANLEVCPWRNAPAEQFLTTDDKTISKKLAKGFKDVVKNL